MRYITLLLIVVWPLVAQEKPIQEEWDYARPMKKVAANFSGRPGVVLHIGDSITYSNPYGQWARGGAGQSEEDRVALKWMHAGDDNDQDGWYLARFDHPDGGRSYTACSGLRLDEALTGGKRGMPSLEKLLDTYKPQAVVFMLGTNDASARRETADFRKQYIVAVDMMLERGIVPIVSTIPPHPQQPRVAKFFNDEIREIARDKKLPLIDFEKEILTRRPDDWNGTLLGKDDVHPSAEFSGTNAASEPTAANLKNSGYLLRGWLSVKKIAEVKAKVFDGLELKPAVKPKVESKPIVAPPGKPFKAAVVRDTWLSGVGDEAHTTNGGATRLKVKSYQEMPLFDIDIAPLKGKIITGATLHVRVAGEERLLRMTVGTVGAEWVEGKGSGYAKEEGASTFARRQHPDKPWTVAGSDLCSVILGSGGTVWGNGDASAPDKNGWQTIPVDPRVLRARVAGAGYGFVLFDDTGSEWTREGEKFTFSHFPNRFIHSRESGAANAPYLTIYVGDEDTTPPGKVTAIESSTADLPAGEAIVKWKTPSDSGAEVAGFQVKLNDIDMARYLIPTPGKSGETVTMHLRDLWLKPGADANIEVRAVDGAGNVGEPATAKVRLSSHEPKPMPGSPPAMPPSDGDLPKLAGARVMVVDELDQFNPLTGALVPSQLRGYTATNHLWTAKTRQVRLFAARNEFIGFQIALQGTVKNVEASLSFPDAKDVAVRFGRYAHVRSGTTALVDPIVPLDGSMSVPDPFDAVEGQQVGSLHVEVYVPHQTLVGDHKGTLTLKAGGETLELPVVLRVWEFTLPDHLSFLTEMNTYGLPASERDYFRAAHRHRTVLNVVPYSQRGEVYPTWGPGWNGELIDTLRWDQRFGAYFTGAAFDDMPRKGVPLECFYLTLHENWPTMVEGHYNGGYWADEAFDEKHRKNFISASRQIAEHINERGWNDTLFHCYLNNKVDYKRDGWSRATSPWLLDEPQSFQDFWAIRYFARAFHEGVSQVDGKAKLLFRADISRPMWQRDVFDGLLDYNVVNLDWRRYRRMVLDRKRANGEIVIEYGSANAIGTSNLQAVAWCVDAWSLGADGVIPWQTVGTREAWRTAESTSLFYPPSRLGEVGPIPSVRLKAFMRGQQDVEYLTLLTKLMNEPRWSIGQQVRERLKLVAKREGTGAAGEDAGVLTYNKLRPQDLWSLRVQIGEALSKAKPEAKKRLVDFRTPRRTVK